VAKVKEHLPGKGKALSSNPRIVKKKKTHPIITTICPPENQG
jgi:hypothetical protein